MSDIAAGTITVFYLFDVADGISLTTASALFGDAAVASRLAPKPATPAYVQYQQPPVVIDDDGLGASPVEGFRLRVKLFDYGVVSLAMSRPYSGSWTDLVGLGYDFIENDRVAAQAEQRCRRLVERLEPALTRPRSVFLSEDYVVFAVTAFEEPLTAEQVLDDHGDALASLLRGERRALSRQERDEVLRHRISYLADDLVIPTWNAAFVYDTTAGSHAALDILEFANSQLLEFRYYDELLDSEMTRIYARLQARRPIGLLGARRYTRAAHAVHSLLIDVNELTDRAENALKFVGDVYAARLFSLAAARLGLDKWKASVNEKLKTLDDIYRFAVEQTSMMRGELLEVIVVLLILLEVVLFVIGVVD